MRKKSLSERQMSAAARVGEAREKAEWLTLRESRGPGDFENAMRRVASRVGLSFGALWRLRYRTPTDLMTSVYFSIIEAYDAERARQIECLRHEAALTAALAGSDHPAVVAAQALVGEGEG